MSRNFSCADFFCKFVQTLGFRKSLQNGKRDKSFINCVKILQNSHEGHNSKNKNISGYEIVALFLIKYYLLLGFLMQHIRFHLNPQSPLSKRWLVISANLKDSKIEESD